MDSKRIYLQGLDYRSTDRDAPPGACRELNDLYPTGDPRMPAWTPVRSATTAFAYAGETDKVLSVYLWERTNLDSVFVWLKGTATNDAIVMQKMTAAGEVSTVDPETVLLTLVGHSATRVARFTQLGDTLIVSIADNGVPKDLFVFMLVDNEVVALPYNCPLPEILLSVSTTSGSIDSSALIRAFYEMIDGTLHPASGIRPVKCDLDSSLKIEFESLADMDAAWKKVVQRIVVYSTEAKANLEDAFKEGVFYRAGTIEHIFESGKKSVTFTPTFEALSENPLLDEDLIFDRGIRCVSLFSYNKLLLLGGVQYNYPLPKRFDGTTAIIKGDDDIYPDWFEDRTINPNQFPVGSFLVWEMVETADRYIIETKWSHRRLATHEDSGGELVWDIDNSGGNDAAPQWVEAWTGAGDETTVPGERSHTVYLDFVETFPTYVGQMISQNTVTYQYRIRAVVGSQESQNIELPEVVVDLMIT